MVSFLNIHTSIKNTLLLYAKLIRRATKFVLNFAPHKNKINVYMSNIDLKTLNHVAHLARLPLSETEQLEYQAVLNQVFQVFDAIHDVDTQNIEPMAHPLEMHQRMRTDQVTEEAQPTGLYYVPKVLEGNV